MWKVTPLAILIVVGISLLQGAHGSARMHSELVQKHIGENMDELNEITTFLRKSLDEVQISKAQVTAEKYQLQQRLAEVHPRCRGTEELAKHVTNLRSWTFDSCVNFTDACLAGENAFMEGCELAWNLSKTMGNILMDLLNCPSINPITAVKCYNDNFHLLRTTITSSKTEIIDFFHRAKDILFGIRVEFDKCVGLPLPSKVYLQNYINQIPQECINTF